MSIAIEQAIRQHILADAYFSGTLRDRLRLNPLPQNAVFPTITYDLQGGPAFATMSGDSTLQRGRVMFTIWSPSYATTRDITTNLVRVMRSANFADSANYPVAQVLNRPGVEPNSEPPIYKRFVDFNLYYLDPVPGTI